jgi:hypothetical protein
MGTGNPARPALPAQDLDSCIAMIAKRQVVINLILII